MLISLAISIESFMELLTKIVLESKLALFFSLLLSFLN